VKEGLWFVLLKIWKNPCTMALCQRMRKAEKVLPTKAGMLIMGVRCTLIMLVGQLLSQKYEKYSM